MHIRVIVTVILFASRMWRTVARAATGPRLPVTFPRGLQVIAQPFRAGAKPRITVEMTARVPSNRMTTRFSITLGLLVTSLAFGSAGCGLGNSDAATENSGGQDQGPPPALVRVSSVEHREVDPRVVVVGSVVPRWTSILASGAEGIVRRFNVEEGQYVQAGDILSELRMVTTDLRIREAGALLQERHHELFELENGSRPEEIDEARSIMLAARAAMDRAEKQLNRTRALFETSAANQDGLDEAHERAEAARQLYSAAVAKLELAEAGPRAEQIEQARARLAAQREQVAILDAEKDKRITRVPSGSHSGYVTRLHTYVGMWLSRGDPIVTLTYLDIIDVVANVDQRDLEHIRLGSEAEVRLVTGYERLRIATKDGTTVSGIAKNETPDSLELVVSANHVMQIPKATIRSRERTHWNGTVVHIVPRSDWQTGSRGFPVRVRMKNHVIDRDGRPQPVLKEGMMAEVTFHGRPVSANLVPKDALVRTSRGTNIYIFDPADEDPVEGTVRQIAVETGISDGAQIQVVADGVESGMLVVTEGAERLRAFQQVRLVGDPPGSTHASGLVGAQANRVTSEE